MPLTTIHLTRHGFRLNWTVDPHTGTYTATNPSASPTGIPSDPPLSAHGVAQSQQLAVYLNSLSAAGPPITRIYSSPFYRCLQTLAPYVSSPSPTNSGPTEQKRVVHGDTGLGEWYGRARFTHPAPATAEVLKGLFDFYEGASDPSIVPSARGETLEELHDRCAYAVGSIVEAEDEMDREGGGDGDGGERAILICTHAASMIAIARALTGRMPHDVCEEDFGTFTCGVSTFRRRRRRPDDGDCKLEKWKPGMAVPRLEWRDGKGVGGGWDCEVNSYCGHLEGGEERGWHFQGDEAFDDERNGPVESIGYKL